MTYVVLGAKVLRKRRGHDFAADGGRRREVCLVRLAPGGGDVWTRGTKSAYLNCPHVPTSTRHPSHPSISASPADPNPSAECDDSILVWDERELTGVELHLEGLEDVGDDDGRFSLAPCSGETRLDAGVACHRSQNVSQPCSCVTTHGRDSKRPTTRESDERSRFSLDSQPDS